MHANTERVERELRKAATVGDQLEILHHAFAGAEALVISCGPSLRTVSRAELQRAARGRVVLAVKQAVGRVPREVDVHLFSPWNFQRAQCRNPSAIRICCTRDDAPAFFGVTPHVRLPLARCNPDLKNAIYDSLAGSECFADHTLDKTPARPWGPGIMYEVGIYLLVHMGIQRAACVGWDIGPPGAMRLDHFYAEPDEDWRGLWGLVRSGLGSGARLIDRLLRTPRLRKRLPDLEQRILHWRGRRYNVVPCVERENEFIARSSEQMYRWLLSCGVELALASDCSYLSPLIPRCQLSDLETRSTGRKLPIATRPARCAR